MEQLEPNRHFLPGRIEKFEHKNAVIVTSDGQHLQWPIKDLPADCEVGTEIRLILTTTATDQAEREQIAKAILNEILKDGKKHDTKKA